MLWASPSASKATQIHWLRMSMSMIALASAHVFESLSLMRSYPRTPPPSVRTSPRRNSVPLGTVHSHCSIAPYLIPLPPPSIEFKQGIFYYLHRGPHIFALVADVISCTYFDTFLSYRCRQFCAVSPKCGGIGDHVGFAFGLAAR